MKPSRWPAAWAYSSQSITGHARRERRAVAAPREQERDRAPEAQVRHEPDAEEAEPGLAVHVAAQEAGERPGGVEMERRERRQALRLVVRDADRVVGHEQAPRRAQVALVEAVERAETAVIVDLAERLGAVGDVDRAGQAGRPVRRRSVRRPVAWTTKKLAQSTVESRRAVLDAAADRAIASGAASKAAR